MNRNNVSARNPKPTLHTLTEGKERGATVKQTHTRRYFFKALTLCCVGFLTILLMAASCGTEKVPEFSISLSPATLTAAQGVGGTFPVTVNISRTNFTSEVTLSLEGAGATATFSPDKTTDNTSTMTVSVPASATAGSFPLTVKAVAGSASKTAALGLTVTAPATITVNGKVTNLAGQGLNGLNVRVTDSTGVLKETASSASGDFTISDVKTPYSVSVVPPPGFVDGYPQTWEGVTRTDPKLVVSFLGLMFSPACPVRTATISGTLKPTGVPAGHTAQVIYVAKGLSFAPLVSNETDSLAAAATTYTLNLNFDTTMCVTELTGALIYLERDGTGQYTRQTILPNFKVVSGDNLTQDLDLVAAVTSTLTGEVTFPSGITQADIFPVLKVGEASVQLEGLTNATAVSGKKGYAFDIPDFGSTPGIQYRTGTTAVNAGGTQYSWAYSDVLAKGATGVNLTLPIVGGAVSPVNEIKTITPTFNQRIVTGMNIYYSYVNNGTTDWFGTSSTNNVRMPSELPAPAQLVNMGAYDWYALTALQARSLSTTDDLLDGRLVKGAYAYISALYNPDGVATGMINFIPVNFNIKLN